MDIGELRGLLTLQDNFSKPINDAAKELGFFSKSFGAVTGVVGLASGAIGAATGAIVALGTRGAAVADVSEAFAGLSAAAGSSADVMLGALREGTLGTISDMELMGTANKALGAGLITSSDDMRTLAAGAQMLADRTGGDTKEAFDTLTTAMASGRTAALKQLGVFVDSRVAIENYAASIGKSKDQLTDAERAHAVATATLATLRNQLQQNGPASADFGDNMAKAKVFVQNFTDNLGVAIAQSPVIRAGMQAVGAALGGAFGNSQKTQIEGIMGVVNSFAIGLTYVAQGGVVAGQVLITAWYGIKTAIGAVLTVIVGVGTAIVGLVSGIAAMGAEIPFVGDKIKGFAQGAESARVYMAELTKATAAETAEAAKGVVGHSAAAAALDKMGGAIINVRSAMQAAEATQVKLNKTVGDMGAAMAGAAAAAQAHAAKVADVMNQLQLKLDMVGRQGLARRLKELELAQAKEIAEIRKNGELEKVEQDKAIKLVEQRYAREVILAKAADDQVIGHRRKLEADITQLKTTGVAARIAQIEVERNAELASLSSLAATNQQEWAKQVILVIEKYKLQSQAAQGHYATVEQAAAAAGFKTRNELQASYDNAKKTYEGMLKNVKYTYAERQRAHEAMIEAQDALEGSHTLSTMQKYELISDSASSILRSLFGKSKAAAIAAALIDTAAAVVKSLAAYPWPWSLAPAAAAAAAGAAQIAKIRSQSAGFREGTEGLTYRDFGREATALVHGPEAIVPQARVGDFAGDVADRLAGRHGGRPLVVQVMLPNGRKLAEAVLPEMPRLLAAHGVG